MDTKKDPYKHNLQNRETRIGVPDELAGEDAFDIENSAIEDYQIVRKIGSGATGIVFEAQHRQLKRRVAIKVLKTHLCKNKVVLERFRREGETIARLKHENVATVFDFVSKGDMHYIVMEYIEGTVLEDIMRRVGKLPVHESVNIIMGVLRGLNIAHENNIVHRDIKPSNITINTKGVPVLFDFGLAKLKNEAKNISTIPVGTPSYMAPEQFQDQLKDRISQRTDFFSLGVMFYEMVTGELPFQGESFSSVMNKIITQDPLPPSKVETSIPKKLDKIILRLLEKDPDFRYRSAREILEDLDCFRKNQPLKHIKNWPLNTMRRFVYRFILKNPYFITPVVILVSFGLAFYLFRYYERLSERTSWIHSYTLESAADMDKDWAFFEGYHEKSQLSVVQRTQSIIPVSRDALILNSSMPIFGVFGGLTSSEVKIDCRLEQVVRLDPTKPSRAGVFICSQQDMLSGYIFYFSEGQAYFSRNFIENVVMKKSVPAEVLLNKKVRVALQKEGSDVNVLLDGRPFFQYHDFIPLSSPEYGFSGIFGENIRMKVEEVSLYALGMPSKTSPVMVGQKLMELGEYQKALEVYKDVVTRLQAP
jgi:serine/threonine protein kinase